MPVSILSLLVVVIGRSRAGSRTRADECAFPATNQRPCSCADGRADTDAFRGLLFSGFRISIMSVSVLAASDGNCEREGEHQK